MISPVSSHAQINPLQSTPKASRQNGVAATTSTNRSKVDSPVIENNETAGAESREAPSLKATEALRAMASQEPTLSQSLSARNKVSPKIAANAYQHSK